MPPPDDDPESREVHDNDVIKGDEEDWSLLIIIFIFVKSNIIFNKYHIK